MIKKPAPIINPTFSDIGRMLRTGLTWPDVVAMCGRPADVCKAHKQVWCYQCPQSESK